MNVVFWSLMLLMLLVAVGIVIWPLLRGRQHGKLAYTQSNLQLHAEKLRELDADLEQGRIDRASYQQARAELERELLADVPEENPQTAATHYTATARRQPALALVIALFVPLLAFALYMHLGMHAAGEGAVGETMARQADGGDMSIPAMAEKLRQRIETQGGSARDWAMLGRAYKYMRHYQAADKAFAESLRQSPEQVDVLLERAEVIALANDETFTPQARALIEKARKLAPDDVNVVWFAGVAEYQSGEYRAAIRDLLRLAGSEAAKDDDVRRSIIGYIIKAREKLQEKGETVPELEAVLAAMEKRNRAAEPPVQAAMRGNDGKARAAKAAAGGARLKVRVTVSDALKARYKASDSVFIYAKAQQGPPMPLAVQRLTLAQLPATVVLDDSMAMMQGMNLSAFGKVVVSARISPSGSAISQSGDAIGSINIDDVHGNASVHIEIDSTVP